MAPTKYRFFPWLMSIRCPVCRSWIDLNTVSASFQCPEFGSKLVATKWVAIVQLLVFLVTFLPLLWFLAGKIAMSVYDGPVDYGDVRFAFWMFCGVIVVAVFPFLVSRQVKPETKGTLPNKRKEKQQA